MDCYNFEDYISSYLDNELSESDKKKFEEIEYSDIDSHTISMKLSISPISPSHILHCSEVQISIFSANEESSDSK